MNIETNDIVDKSDAGIDIIVNKLVLKGRFARIHAIEYLKIIQLCAEGKTAHEIGELVELSFRTIQAKVDKIRIAYSAKNIPHLVSICYQEGILKVLNHNSISKN